MIEVSVHYGDVDRALPVLKKTIQKEGRGLKMKKQYHEKNQKKELKRKLKREKRGISKNAEGSVTVGNFLIVYHWLFYEYSRISSKRDFA